MSEDGSRSTELEHQEWYHGYRPRKDVILLLKEVGDFLVRATETTVDNKKASIVISVKVGSGKSEKDDYKHLSLNWTNGKWQLMILAMRTATRNHNHSKSKGGKDKKVPSFDNVVELVDHYRENMTPLKVKLKKAISRPKWHIKHEKVNFDKTKDLLGSGNFCHVYKGLYHRTQEEIIPVAVKIWHDGNTPAAEADEGRAARNAMLTEARIMSYYTHTHIIQLFGVACDHPPILIIMEFCPGGNLQHHLEKCGKQLEISERVLYGFEIAKGMKYLHSKKCVHRDLAARNCLISDRGHIKISDFGLSQMVGEEINTNSLTDTDEENSNGKGGKGNQIPVRWMAPESLKKPICFSEKSDVWSYGVLLYEVFNDGEKPWKDDPTKRVATHIRKNKMPEMPSKTPKEIVDLVVKKIWVLEPNKRPDMKDICAAMRIVFNKMKLPPVEKMLINSIKGVKRVKDELDDTCEIDDEPEPKEQKTDSLYKQI